MEEQLILVDEDDHVIGYGEKMDVHRKEQLHRAFSLFIFNRYDQTMLVHRRAYGKYHSGGLWTNSCCSHPRKGEALRDAVIRRMEDELGLTFPQEILEGGDTGHHCSGLRELEKFQYYQKYADCAESEIDHVYLLTVWMPDLIVRPNPEEISEFKWVSSDGLKKWLEESPGEFTAWFPKAFEIVLNNL